MQLCPERASLNREVGLQARTPNGLKHLNEQCASVRMSHRLNECRLNPQRMRTLKRTPSSTRQSPRPDQGQEGFDKAKPADRSFAQLMYMRVALAVHVA